MEKYHRVGNMKRTAIFLLFSLVILIAGNGTALAVSQYSLTCLSCHGMPPKDSATGTREIDGANAGAFKGSHAKHANTQEASCSRCHSNPLPPAPEAYQSGHRDSKIQFTGTINGSPQGIYYKNNDPNTVITFTNQTSVSEPGKCSNVNCHFEADATPAWGTTFAAAPAECGSCHATSPTTGRHSSHLTHYTCSKCHPDHNLDAYPYSHASSAGKTSPKISTTFSVYTGSNYKFLKSVSADRKVGSCTNVACHSPGQNSTGGALGAGDYAMQSWGNPASGACGTCHKATKATLTSGSHTKHLNATGVNGCADCHIGVVGDGSSYNSSLHVNTFMNVTGAYSKGKSSPLGDGYGTCSAASCHDDGTNKTVVSPQWGAVGITPCSACHDVEPTTGSHTSHFSQGAVCADCHKGAVKQSAYPVEHGDGNVDVFANDAGDLGYPIDKAKGSAYASCSTAHCHDDGTGTPLESPVWGETITDCSQCHATVPPTGSHVVHLSSPGVSCSSCHEGAVQATTPSTQHQDNNIDVYKTTAGDLGYEANKLKGSPYTSCSTAACHSNPSNAGQQLLSPVWGEDAGTKCDYCHAKRPTTGSHQAHYNAGFFLCADCHKGAIEDSVSPVEHVDGNIDVYKSVPNDYGYGLNKGVNTAPSACSAGSCHEDGRNNFVTSPTWGQSNSDCSACHAKRPTTGSHTQHVVIGVTCANCHKGASEGTSAPQQHMDGNVDVYKTSIGDLGYPPDKIKGSGYVSCNNSSCHGTQSPTWGVTTPNYQCTKCHGKGTLLANYSTTTNRQSAPGYDSVGVGTGQQTGTIISEVSNDPKVGAHDSHMRARNYLGKPSACSDCHVVPATAFIAGHMDGSSLPTFSRFVKNLQTTPSSNIPYTWTTNGIDPVYSGVTGQCSNTYCHGGTLPGGSNKTPVWNDGSYMTGAPAQDCGLCHGNPPTTGRSPHGGVGAAQGGGNECTACHPHNGTRFSTDPLLGNDFHVNGKLEANKFCDTCHDYDTRGTGGKIWGKNLIAVEGYGAHAMHINYLKIRMNITTMNPNLDVYGTANFNGTCGVCHSRLESDHQQSNRLAPRNITFGGASSVLRKFGTNLPEYRGATGFSSSVSLKTCANVDCHYKTSPIWQPY